MNKRGKRPAQHENLERKEVPSMEDYIKLSPEEFATLSFLLQGHDFVKELLEVDPAIFGKYQGVIQRLKSALRSGGIDALFEEAAEILGKDERVKSLLASNRGFIATHTELEASIKLLEKRYERSVVTTLVEDYRNGKIELDELEARIRNVRMEVKGKRWKFTLNEEKEDFLKETEEEEIHIPFVGVEVYPSDLILITAQTKSGKTTLAMNVILSIIASEEEIEIDESTRNSFSKKALYVTYEVPKRKLFKMLVGIESEKNWKEIDNEDMEAFLRKYGDNLSIKEGLNLDDLLDFLILFHPDVFVIDYDQLIPTKGRFESEERRVASIVRSLKNVATQIGSVGIILSQVNEEGKARYSREKEHAASVHIHLEKPENSDDIEFEVKLNRWGKTGAKGRLKVNWDTRKIERSEDFIVGG